jgi:PadR family transcriptional regulator, regulatory protein PadR
MASFTRSSEQVTTVVLALAEEPAAWRYGYELCQRLDLQAGSLYPALMRLADRGLLETAWESGAPAGRPPRHLYRLSGPGVELAGRMAAERSSGETVSRMIGVFGWHRWVEGT